MKKPITISLVKMLLILTLVIESNTARSFASHNWQMRTVTLTASHVSMRYVFENIYQQTGLVVKLNNSVKDLNDAQIISVNFKQTEIPEVMEFLLSNRKDIKFLLKNKSIIVYKDGATSNQISVYNNPADTSRSIFPVSGRVTDQAGNPLPGVSVTLKYSNKGAITNDDGRFSFPNADKGEIAIFRSIGFLSKEMPIKNNTLLIQLAPYIGKLDETVVIAYGTTTKRKNTGNVGTIKAADIEKQPVNNPILALQGRIPGIFITQTSGLSGAAVNVRIQGENSLQNGNNPLYIVDGIPYTSELLPSMSTNNYGIISNGSPLNFLSSSDIESIDVLKDADATAIYGSRAANGAVLITTKKGKSGKSKLDVNVQNGWGQLTRKMQLLDTKQYLQMRNEAKKNDGQPINPTDYDINGVWDTTKSTDWQKELLGNTAHYTDIQGSISGGNTNTQFLIGGTFHKETTVFPGDFADQKTSFHFNINNTSTNQKFRLQASGSYLVDKNRLPNTDLTNYALTLPPTAPPLFTKDGGLNWVPDASGNSTFYYNPAAYLYNIYKLNTSNLIGNAIVSYEIVPSLDVKTSLGYTRILSDGTIAVSSLSNRPEYNALYNLRSASYSNSGISTWIIEPQLTYVREIKKGRIDALLGTTIQETNSNQVQFYGSGYLSDAVLEDIHSAPQLYVVSSVATQYKYNALFSRLKYTYDDKYIISLNARRDGSSRFGDKNQFHNFGSAALAWIFSGEKFVENALPFISFGKLRGSYGLTGSDQIGEYQFLNLYAPLDQIAVPYQNVLGLSTQNLTNPYLAWEQTKKLQFGLELGLLKDRILFSVNYNHNRSSNQLLSYVLPVFAGFQSVLKNFPATIQNTGWEFSLSTKNISTKNFIWSSDINLTIPQNKLIDFPNLERTAYFTRLKVGQPVMSTKLYHLLGVDPTTGQYQYEDSKGNPTFNPDYVNDRSVFMKTYPDFYGGLQNNFKYKNFELDILFQFVKQKGIGYQYGTSNPGGFLSNMPTSVLDRWQKPGDKNPIQRFNSDDALFVNWANTLLSDKAWADASYIRLKNISLSWQMPTSWREKLHLNGCQLFIHCQNLLTFTKYIGLDPETTNVSVLPPLRVVAIGGKISL
ncbi:MAG: SusC/RagA family TonB-linked outer membrane protein [Chitinophaga sp.]|uniref:SusC/RagA family TonB-linked outer membrane protein n=1 Tax=Chitinophaga sp. TaxID=1869181 RepID=UPI001B1988AB|nr:SusC/RagA family TonB-linked outer membrane protein [Chitinophaga sp.]MBO9727321.1 SusC/RagA family TonB-linked outer membrane protein [Chitinophaga sp.]